MPVFGVGLSQPLFALLMMQHHPLRIPSGWMVTQNHFYDIVPSEVLNEGRLDYPFVQDVLQLHNQHLRMTLDLGWYPDGDPNGSFRLVLIQWDEQPNHNEMPKQSITQMRNGIKYRYTLEPELVGNAWDHPLVDVASTDQGEIAQQINDILARVAQGQLGS